MLPADLVQRLERAVADAAPLMVAERRDFHHYAETGWTEFRTASLVARRLVDLGLGLQVGREVVDGESRMGVPAAETLAAQWERACAQGGDAEFLEAGRGGFTGVVGILRRGPGPTVGLRFDIDALDLEESLEESHRPAAEGFVSVNRGAAHACAHDGHAALGLGVARVLATLDDALQGTVKLVFQPAEEGVRGAKSMVVAGAVDDIDAMLAVHLYSGWPTGQVALGRGNFMATDKFDAYFTGEAAHAGGRPHGGRNALLAAATAVLNLHAIPRHRDGPTRINVGRLVAGQGRNVIPPSAHLMIETRGATSALNDYVRESAESILAAAAAMYGCKLEIRAMGAARSAESDPALVERVNQVVAAIPGLSVRDPGPGGGSEDYTYMMRRVQERGGLAAALGMGADLGGWGHHTANFDFDEAALPLAAQLLVTTVLTLMRDPLA